MPLVKNGNNKAQLKNAIKKSLNEEPVLTKARKREIQRAKLPHELDDIYDIMHGSR
jgi:hypothetical protein